MASYAVSANTRKWLRPKQLWKSVPRLRELFPPKLVRWNEQWDSYLYPEAQEYIEYNLMDYLS